MARFAVLRRNEALDSWRDNFNSGKLRIYSGTRPVNADTALSGNTLLAELVMNATSFPVSSAGVLTANAITSDASADATGTPTFARFLESDGSTVICDLSCAVGSGELNLAAAPSAGAVVAVTSLTLTFGVGA